MGFAMAVEVVMRLSEIKAASLVFRVQAISKWSSKENTEMVRKWSLLPDLYGSRAYQA